jgi:leader peptidase (prepilin peptidase)/N-methyltransferase
MMAQPQLIDAFDIVLPIAGAAWGSFVATAILRGHRGGTFLTPSRSQCAGCGRALGSIDLLPIAGYLLRRGRCQACGTRIPALYPLTELGGLFIGLSAALAFEGGALALAMLFGAMLLAIAARDAVDFTIPDWLSLPLLGLGLGTIAWLDRDAFPDHALAALIGGAMLWLVAWMYKRRRGRDGLGFGDVKLFAALGAWLGLEGLAPCLLLAALAALGFVTIRALLTRQRLDGGSMVPFGTWLGIAAWLVYAGPPLLGKL